MGTILLVVVEAFANSPAGIFEFATQGFELASSHNVFKVPDVDFKNVPKSVQSGMGLVLTILYWVGVGGCIATFTIGAFMWGWGYTSGGGPQQKMGKLMVIGGAVGAILIGLAPVVIQEFFAQGVGAQGGP